MRVEQCYIGSVQLPYRISHFGIAFRAMHSGVPFPKLAEVNMHIDNESCKTDSFKRWKVNKLKMYICCGGQHKKEVRAPTCEATVQQFLACPEMSSQGTLQYKLFQYSYTKLQAVKRFLCKESL